MFNWLELRHGCAKGMLVALNVLFIFIAISAFAFATVDLRVLSKYGEDQAGGCITGNVVIIIASGLWMLLGGFGCVGTAKGSAKILYTYVALLAALLVMEVIITIFVSIQRFGLQYRVTEWLREEFYSNVTGDARVEHDRLWDKLQTTYECCGLNGPDDYSALGLPISFSCCRKVQLVRRDVVRKKMYQACVQSHSYYNLGCEDEIMLVLQADEEYLLGVAVLSFWLEAAGMLLAMWVANFIKNSVRVYKNTVKY